MDDLFFSLPSLEVDIQYDPNPGDDRTPRITAGGTMVAKITVKNIASYINENIGIEVIFLDPKSYEEVKFKIRKDIPAEGELNLNYFLETDETTPQHFYGVFVRIYSRVDEFILSVDRSFYVDNPKVPTARPGSILPLLLKQTDSK